MEKEILFVPIEMIPEDMSIESFVEKWTEWKDDYRVIRVIDKGDKNEAH